MVATSDRHSCRYKNRLMAELIAGANRTHEHPQIRRNLYHSSLWDSWFKCSNWPPIVVGSSARHRAVKRQGLQSGLWEALWLLDRQSWLEMTFNRQSQLQRSVLLVVERREREKHVVTMCLFGPFSRSMSLRVLKRGKVAQP